MKLSELNPDVRPAAVPFSGIWGIEYDCPECTRQGKGKDHRIWTPSVDGGSKWGWKFAGTGIDDISFVPTKEQPLCSVRVVSGQCHGHWNVSNGEIHFHGDSH